jgi:hypothetical protein
LLGGLAAYLYLTQGGGLRGAVNELWSRASSPPPSHAGAKR